MLRFYEKLRSSTNIPPARKQCFSRSNRFPSKVFPESFFPPALLSLSLSLVDSSSFYELKLSIRRERERVKETYICARCASSTSLSGYIRAGLNCRRNQRTEAKAAARFPPLMPVASSCVHASRRLLTWAVTSASGTSKDYRSFRTAIAMFDYAWGTLT